MDEIEQSSIKQFNQWAKWFDSPIFSYWQFYLSNKKALHMLDIKNDSSLLDIGCGTGILLKQAANLQTNIKLYGLDISAGMIEKAKQKLGEKAHLRIASANKLPYHDNTFDYVTCCTSLHHHQNTQKSISEMYRVVKPRVKS